MTQPTDSAEAGRSPSAKFSGDTLAGDGVRRWFAWESAVMAITARPVRRTGVVLALAVLTGCGSSSPPPAAVDDGATVVVPDSEAPDHGEAVETGPEATVDTVAPDDATAGVRSTDVREIGDGDLTTVPGTLSGPSASRKVDVAVQIEGGVDVDPTAFADFVMATLNDPRGWTSAGYGFNRVEQAADADVIVVLASPQTSADMCRPLITGGRLSCREGRRAILTSYRWVNGQDDYGTDRTGYRQYVVNHEVGHFLGRGHKSCPGAGAPAPVMMQQTKGLKGCAPNPWPSVAS